MLLSIISGTLLILQTMLWSIWMALHKNFPDSPHAILDPEVRWFPADEALRETSFEKLLPPLVPELRKQVKAWRDKAYKGASETSRSLLNWWFNVSHLVPQSDGTMAEFQYYFAQREALETIVYLYDVAGVKDKYDLMRFDSSGAVSTGMFDETWRRFVVKMATGTGKTKVMSLVLAWSYFHRLYEPESELSRNFLVITPNIIVLDRIYKDFQGLNIFFSDPVLPDNGVDGHNWRDDFQLTLHKQDEVRITRPVGNIFLTNIHRVYAGEDIPPSPGDENTMDYFLGKRPVGATTDSKVDLGIIVRDINELMVINDEAHHIHDNRLAWFKSIEDIHNRMKHKGSSDAFMEFVESIQAEGVVLEHKPMGEGTQPKTPLIVEIDQENEKKDLEILDIEVPVLSLRVYREYKNLADLDVTDSGSSKVKYQYFSEEEQREIVFKDITTGEVSHTTILDTAGVADYRSVIGYFSRTIMKDLRLVSGYDVLYGKVKDYVQTQLFDCRVELDDPNTLRNLSELAATKMLIETFKRAINALTVKDKGDAGIRDMIKLRKTRPFVAKDQGYLIPKKSVFNKIIVDSHFELLFAGFLENCDDVISFAKNYLAVHFKLDYVNADNDISNYHPDFLIKLSEKEIYIAESKGLEDLDVPLKMQRLRQWCEDVNKAQSDVKYDFVYVDEENFNKYKPASFKDLITSFVDYKEKK
jgi:hypothetical protein